MMPQVTCIEKWSRDLSNIGLKVHIVQVNFLIVLGEHECALTCKDKKTKEVYTLQEEVEDGTPCGRDSSGLCLAGKCQVMFF